MTSLVHNLTLIAGETAVLQCTAAGSPTPYFRWLKSGKSLTMGGRMSVIAGGSLMIESTMASDEANYTCQAVNNVGSVHMAIYLEVIGPPNITSFRSSVTGVQGDTISLPCRAKGFPPPVITWSRSGQTIPYDRRQSIDNGTLLIGNVQKSDSGKYTCTAVNTAGERDSVTMTVSIVGK
ncbi:predicted protein [Nematostella vectensis]|uniref:Ig-like domain-containing protein n=1 Tax=Nematostella vectensis TaxID=45351 RepID=A7SQE0_NEMVE|nr:predicted protein [Nematostella vectensis]|eukprot:XP_001626158.1 predicted protein [Nematostella vectensis]